MLLLQTFLNVQSAIPPYTRFSSFPPSLHELHVKELFSLSPYPSIYTPPTDSLLDFTITKTVPKHVSLLAMHNHKWILGILVSELFYQNFIFHHIICTELKQGFSLSFSALLGPKSYNKRRWQGDEESPHQRYSGSELEGWETNPDLPGWFPCPFSVLPLLDDLNWLILCDWVEPTGKSLWAQVSL